MSENNLPPSDRPSPDHADSAYWGRGAEHGPDPAPAAGSGEAPATSSVGENEPTRTLPPMPDPYAGGYGSSSAFGNPDAGTDTLVREPRPARGRRVFAASLLVAALVVGAGAGVGGAAAYSTWLEDDAAGGGGATTPVTTSKVVDSTSDVQGNVEQVAAAVLPSVVKLDVTGSEGSGSGSGIVISSDGQILTNNHVAELAEGGGAIQVSFNDGSTAPAEIVGTDPLTDIALVQAQDVSGLTPATIGSSGDLAVGEGVVAIGSPFGLDATVTSGIVSAVGRPVDVGADAEGNVTAYPAVQTDAAINPGNSGGPLVDAEGRVIGINSSIRSSAPSTAGSSAGSIGLGFAIPIDDVLPIVEQIQGGETPTHALLGVSIQPVQAAQGEASTALAAGAQVREVTPGSAADEAGLEPGDVVTKVDDVLIGDPDSLITTVRSYRPGDQVQVTYVRDGSDQTTELSLGSDGE